MAQKIIPLNEGVLFTKMILTRKLKGLLGKRGSGRLAGAVFLFFLVKGMLWLALPATAVIVFNF